MQKNRPIFIIASLLILAVVAFFLYFRAFRNEASVSEPTQPAQSSPGALESEEVPPLPNIALEIDTEQELSTFRGIPLIFTVRVANQRAANADVENRARRDSIVLIQDKAAKGEIGADKAKLMLALARRTRPVRAVKLGSPNQGWEQFVHFEYRKEGGSFQRADWVLKPVPAPGRRSVTLDAQARAEVDYALPPEAAGRLSAGSVEVIAVLEVPEGGSLPQDNWRGRVASEPVRMKILPAPVNPSAEEKGTINLQMADFYAVLKDWPNVLASAEEAIAANPKLIRAHMRAADAKEVQGDLKGARDAYGEAKRLFDEQYPNSYEHPLFLIQKISSLDSRLRNR